MSTNDSFDESQAPQALYPASRIAKNLRPLDQLLGYVTESYTLDTLYFGDLKVVLAAVAARLAAYEARELFPETPAAELAEAFAALEAAVPAGVSMADLLRAPASQWPEGVHAASERLYAMGFTLPWNHVPDGEKAAVARLFDQRKFSEILGRYTLRDLYARAKSDCTPRERHLVKIGREAGVLRRHTARPFLSRDPVVNNDKNDMACYQAECYYREECYCEMAESPATGCSWMSDPWDPNWDPPQ